MDQINQEAKTAVFVANPINAAMYREQAQVLGENLHSEVSQLVKRLGIPDSGFKASYENTTGLTYDRNVLGFKVNGLANDDITSLVKLRMQSLKMAQAAQGLARVSTVIDGVENAEDIKTTCEKYGEGSTLCHKTVVGDTAGFVAGEVIGSTVGKTVGRWAVCNAALDIETAGTGILICTVAIGAASIIAGNVSGDVAKSGSETLYEQGVAIYSKEHILEK